MKSARNCWINLKNEGKTFIFPSFNDSFGNNASFQDIESLYHHEKDKCLKLGFKLIYSTINTSSIERQKVPLALKIFDDTTSAAIKSIYPEKNGLFNFLRMFNRVWKCFNINTSSKGNYLNDPDLLPFTSTNDPRLEFLNEFANWLDNWKSMKSNSGKLSSQTFQSMSFSCRSLSDLIKHLLSQGFSFVLTATFSSDCIESAFGNYRQSVGGGFHLSHDQVLAVEKKMRVKSSILLHGKIIKLDDTMVQPSEISDTVSYNSLNVDLSEFYAFDDNIREASVYVGGYIIKKLNKNSDCVECLAPLTHYDEQAKDFIDSVYFDTIDRGLLSVPSPRLVYIVMRCVKFFEIYLEDKFHNSTLNLQDTIDLFYSLMEDFNDLEKFNNCSTHATNASLVEALTITAKILLKNYSIARNDEIKSNRPQMAKRSRHNSEIQYEKFY